MKRKAGDVRVVIIGGPRCGKSTVARQLQDDLQHDQGLPIFCGDPKELVKDPESGVTYLPAGLGWSESSQYIADRWLQRRGSWCCEGVAMVRALRKHVRAGRPVDFLVLYLAEPQAGQNPGQAGMAKAIHTIWRGIRAHFPEVLLEERDPAAIATAATR